MLASTYAKSKINIKGKDNQGGTSQKSKSTFFRSTVEESIGPLLDFRRTVELQLNNRADYLILILLPRLKQRLALIELGPF